MRIIGFVKKCTEVSRYGWFETDLGFNIRKPLWMYPELLPVGLLPEESAVKAVIFTPLHESIMPTQQRSLWARLWAWFINLWR